MKKCYFHSIKLPFDEEIDEKFLNVISGGIQVHQRHSTVHLFTRKQLFNLLLFSILNVQVTKNYQNATYRETKNIYSSFRNKKREKFATLKFM